MTQVSLPYLCQAPMLHPTCFLRDCVYMNCVVHAAAQAKTTVINFTVTGKGLEEQLLGRVIQKEQRSLEEQLSRVLQVRALCVSPLAPACTARVPRCVFEYILPCTTRRCCVFAF